MIRRISTTRVKFKLTLMGTRSHVVLLLSVLKYALRAEHLVAVLAEELNFLVLVHVAERELGAIRSLSFLLFTLIVHGKTSNHRIVDWESVCSVLMDCLVKRAFDLVVFANLCGAFVTEGVSARVGKGLSFLVVVAFVADLTVEDGIHILNY